MRREIRENSIRDKDIRSLWSVEEGCQLIQDSSVKPARTSMGCFKQISMYSQYRTLFREREVKGYVIVYNAERKMRGGEVLRKRPRLNKR